VIVIDASAAIELLLGTSRGKAFRARLTRRPEQLCAPHLLDVETAHVLRRYERSGDLSAPRAEQALADLEALPVTRYPHTLLLRRMWQLRANLTGYDAAYVALAESLDFTLVTCDNKLASTPGHRARIDLLD